MKKLAGYAAIALATLAGTALLWAFREAVLLFILSLAVAAVLRPLMDSLTAHRLPGSLALAITYLAVVIILLTLLFSTITPILSELQGLATDLPGTYRQVQSLWLGGSWWQRLIAQNSPDPNKFLQLIPTGQWNAFFQNFLVLTRGTVHVLSDALIVFVLSIYWSADQEHFKRLWLSLLPSEMRTRWREIWQNIEKEIGAYLRSELLQGLLTLLFLAAGYQLMGVRYPVLLALFAAISWLIVWFGGPVAVLLGFLAGLSINPLMGAATAIFTLAVLIFLEFFVQPRFFNRGWISSLFILVMLVFMVKQFGLIGFLIAPPAAGVLQIIISQLVLPVATTPTTVPLEAPPLVQIDLLKERLHKIEASYANQPDLSSPEIISLIGRLDKLLDQVKQEEPFVE